MMRPLRVWAVARRESIRNFRNPWEDLPFTIQESKYGHWKRVIDTSLESPNDFCELGAEVPLTSQTYIAKARSIVVLIR